MDMKVIQGQILSRQWCKNWACQANIQSNILQGLADSYKLLDNWNDILSSSSTSGVIFPWLESLQLFMVMKWDCDSLNRPCHIMCWLTMEIELCMIENKYCIAQNKLRLTTHIPCMDLGRIQSMEEISTLQIFVKF